MPKRSPPPSPEPAAGSAMDLEQLRRAVRAERRFKYVFFWGHQPRRPGEIDRTCFSQWYMAPFTVEGVSYPTAEHFMMAEKARLFGDAETGASIVRATSPAAAKKLGREVRGFDQERWEAARSDIVVRGNLAKFGQHPALRAFLVGTGDRVLVEASPADRVWGIGLDEHHEDAERPLEWRGLNLLGFALMDVRARLR